PQLLAQDQPLGHDELLLVDRHDQDAVLFPGLPALGDDLAERHVLDLNLLAQRIDLEAAGDLLDLGSDDDLADLLHGLVGDQLLLAQAERLGWPSGRLASLVGAGDRAQVGPRAAQRNRPVGAYVADRALRHGQVAALGLDVHRPQVAGRIGLEPTDRADASVNTLDRRPGPDVQLD